MPRLHLKPVEDTGAGRKGTGALTGVYRGRADKGNAFGGNTLSQKVADSNLVGGTEEAGEMINHDTVLFFGHGPVERTAARFNMHHRDLKLSGAKGTGQSRVGVALHNHHRRSLGLQNRFKPTEHAGRLLAVGG